MKINKIEIIARIGTFGVFLGHGLKAIGINQHWIPYITFFEYTEKQAIHIMQTIGVVDIIVACFVLFYPIRIMLFWAIFWTFLTALIRPIIGVGILEFLERSANICLPLVLLMMQGFPKNRKGLFKIRDKN